MLKNEEERGRVLVLERNCGGEGVLVCAPEDGNYVAAGLSVVRPDDVGCVGAGSYLNVVAHEDLSISEVGSLYYVGVKRRAGYSEVGREGKASVFRVRIENIQVGYGAVR